MLALWQLEVPGFRQVIYQQVSLRRVTNQIPHHHHHYLNPLAPLEQHLPLPNITEGTGIHAPLGLHLRAKMYRQQQHQQQQALLRMRCW
jgi:hypothetical protein